jgi:hypothetical protein
MMSFTSRDPAVFQASPGPVYPLSNLEFVLAWLVGISALSLNYSLLAQFGLDTTEGNALEKLHPSFILVIVTLVIRAKRVPPQSFSTARITNIYIAVMMCLLFYNLVVIGREFSVILVTYISPVLFLLLWRNLTYLQIQFSRATIHMFFCANAIAALYEYFTGTFLFEVMSVNYASGGDQIVDATEWTDGRVTGLFNHPLSASMITASYVLVCSVMIASEPRGLLHLLGLGSSLLVLPLLGGRGAIAALVAMIAMLTLNGIRKTIATGRIERRKLAISAGALIGMSLLIIIAMYGGFFDNFVHRLTDDNGSAETRQSALDIFQVTSLSELIFGDFDNTMQMRSFQIGTPVGIEIFWLAFLIKYGLLASFFVFPVLIGLSTQLFRDRGPQGSILWLYCLIAQSGTVGLSVKSTALTTIIFLAYALISHPKVIDEWCTPPRGGRHKCGNLK